MNNLRSYCGLVDPRISASDNDLPVILAQLSMIVDQYTSHVSHSVELVQRKPCSATIGFLIASVQVNLCQKHILLHQLTQNMTTDCSLNYEFST